MLQRFRIFRRLVARPVRDLSNVSLFAKRAVFEGGRLRGICASSQSYLLCSHQSYSASAAQIKPVSTPLLSIEEERLINRGDFIGVKSTQNKPSLKRPPESTLSLIEDSLRRNFRVNGETLFVDVLKRLENDNEALVGVLRRSPDRWLPTIISSCGSPLSNLHRASRMQILNRLMAHLQRLEIPVSLTSFNRYLAVLLENEDEFDVDEIMKNAEETRSLQLDQTSFRYLLERLARQGRVEQCRHMVYKMAQRGLTVDPECNASLVYCFAVRGHHAKADSLVEQTSDRFGPVAVPLAIDACAKAAAARASTDRLRKVLRRAVDANHRLTLSTEGLFETIWLLAEKSREGDGAEFVNLTEQMLEHTNHSAGFFRYMFREVERHISHEHYYTALALLEETNRVKDCLKNQQRSLFMEQMLSRLCRQLVRCQVPKAKVNDIANRATAMLRHSLASDRIYDELLFAALTYRELDSDQRFEYLSSFVDSVDRQRARPHLMLPILAGENELEGRLKIIFRCSALGYRDIAQLDPQTLIRLVLQPLYDRQRFVRRQGAKLSRLDETARILKSYGCSEDSVWRTVQEWWRIKKATEKDLPDEVHTNPTMNELSGWLREKYFQIYENNTPKVKSNGFVPTYGRLKAFVDGGDSTKVSSFLASYGWPEGTDFEDVVPPILELYLEHEEWPQVQKMLLSLAGQSSLWVREDGTTYSPIKNFHLLKILRRSLIETEESPIRKLVDYSYELKRLFPNAIAHYDTFFDTLYEYNRLFTKCFESAPLTVAQVDECIDLLRTIIKLDIISLHPNETLTTTIVGSVLKKLGWAEAVNTWMKFQSGFYCSNAIVALLRYSVNGLAHDKDTAMKNIQYVLHKAQNFISSSRVHSIYAAVLVMMRKYDDADKYLEQHKENIEPVDSVHAIRLINALRYRSTDEDFLYHFSRVLFEKTRLGQDEEACKSMQSDWMRLCETRRLGALGLRMYELFSDNGVVMPSEEKCRLAKMAEQHEKLAKQWIHAPNGMLNVTETDHIITSSDTWRIQQRLKADVAAV